MKPILFWPVTLVVIAFCLPGRGEERESDYYELVSLLTPHAGTDSRSPNWKPSSDGLALEVSGIAVMDDRRIAVAIRKGEVWILDGIYDDLPNAVRYHRFASGLHEPLGLLWHQGGFYAAQRSELTKMVDTDGDLEADDYLTIAKGWGLTGHYHEYAYGPKLDRNNNLWITLNIGLGLKGDQLANTEFDPVLKVRQARWRGWGLRIDPQGKLDPICAGMRSPCGIGMNEAGDMFYTDQQGDWVGTNSLHHMRLGSFSNNPESLASINLEGSPIRGIRSVPNGIPWPLALQSMPELSPPAVWFPYKKVGQSSTDIMLDASGGRFGPFKGQLFVGEFTLAGINRVFLEKVDGEYQGVCFPFRQGMASAVLRLAQGVDGSVFAGLTNRGWSSLGTASYGLQRLKWTGKVPFEILEMRALHDGFELVFTMPLDTSTAARLDSYSVESYTYLYHSTYGSEPIQSKFLEIEGVKISEDKHRVQLKVAGLRPHFVHELIASGVRSQDGRPLLHSDAYYTLNRIPRKP